MNAIWQAILASGIFSLLVTLVVTRIVNRGFQRFDDWQKTRVEHDLLLATKIDKLGELTVLMADKLHEAGVVNGDLEEIKKKYKQADEDYEKHIKKLAAEVLKR